MTHPHWRISSFSGQNGSCVQVADVGGTALVRNSNHPDRATLSLSPSAMAAFVDAAKAGEYDDLG
jgi:hypothetical protein